MQDVTENTTEESGLHLQRVTHGDRLKKASTACRCARPMEASITHTVYEALYSYCKH